MLCVINQSNQEVGKVVTKLERRPSASEKAVCGAQCCMGGTVCAAECASRAWGRNVPWNFVLET